ncbi:ComEA family DNA-binding protein [Acidipila rosea]|nr:helix-hairpin-helix domain-containing protein [Acidipila rosea]MBW4044045.1 helix-hairpin-helix domain-containing protein [Acidobacteriota bacterium]
MILVRFHQDREIPMHAIHRTRTAALAVALLGLGLAGCSFHHPTQAERDAKLKQQTADATAAARKNAELIGARARVAAADAERKLNIMASGVKQGWKEGKPAAGRININSADRVQLVRLPGISVRTAERIIAARPYGTSRELVRKHILTQEQYDRISSRVTTD